MQATMHETQVPATRVVPTAPRWVRTGLRHLLMGAIAVVMAMPFVAMVLLAIRPEGTTSLSGMFFSTEFTLDHFRANLQNDSMVRWILNSFIYAFVSVVLVLLLCSMAGYAFAKKRFFGRDQIFWTFIAMLVVPGQVTLVPLFILIVQLDGANTYWGLIVPTIANAQGVFLMRQYIKGIPDELIEAAKIDGAAGWRIFRYVTLPLLGPTIRISVFLSVIYTIQLFDLVWILTEGGPAHSSETLAVTMFALGFERSQVGYASAISVVMFVLSLIFALVYQRFVMRRDLEGATTAMGGKR